MQSCSYYLQKGHCKFGHNCKFDHPMGTLEYSPSASSLNEIPIASYVLSSSATAMVATVSFPELQDEFSPETKPGAAKTKDQSYGNSLSSAVDLVLSRNGPFSLSTVQYASQSSNSSITRNSREDSEVHHPGWIALVNSWNDVFSAPPYHLYFLTQNIPEHSLFTGDFFNFFEFLFPLHCEVCSICMRCWVHSVFNFFGGFGLFVAPFFFLWHHC